MKTIVSIQTLRALASLSVVVVHTTYEAGQYSGIKAIGDIGAFGQIGVDIFFVISGFIMYGTLRSKALTSSEFMLDRATRIWPPYVICSFILLAFSVVGSSVPLPSFYHFALSVLLIPHTGPSGSALPFLRVGWTLTYEIFFYGCLSCSLQVRPHHITFSAGLFFSCVMFGLYLRPNFPVGRIFGDPMLLEFVAGLAIGAIWSRDFILPRRVSALSIIAACFLASGYRRPDASDDLARLFFWGLPAAIIVFCALSFEQARPVKCRVGLVLGSASYSIYLTHILVLSCLGRVWKITGVPPVYLLIFTCITCSVGFGIVFYYFIETPSIMVARSISHKVCSLAHKKFFVSKTVS